jgi:hypothetical protein
VPDNGAHIDGPAPLFEWTIDSPDCPWTAFRIQVAESRTFDSILQEATLPADQTTWQSDPGMASCITHSWRVRARGSDGEWAPWSNVWTFSIRGRTCA